MMVAPWVHYRLSGQWDQMTKKEVSLVIRRCMALGIDPLNDRRSTSGAESTGSTPS
jgi:hypothetical protein